MAAPVDVMFMPHNGYHAREMAGVATELARRGMRCLFVDVTDAYRDEGARDAIARIDLPSVRFKTDALRRFDPAALFVMNDWGGVVGRAVLEARLRDIRTIGLVEGVQDFEDTHVEHVGAGRIRSPYRWVELALLVGEYDRQFFPAHRTEVTGSTRIEQLLARRSEVEPSRLAVINSNFTYNLYTDIQRAWIDEAVEACERAEIEYVISQHHADTADLSMYRVAQEPLYDLLARATVTISRFSGVMLESLAIGTPVIYFNPHDERIDAFQNAMGAYPIAEDSDALRTAIASVAHAPREELQRQAQDFFAFHVSVDPARPSHQRIADAVEREIVEARKETATAPV